MFWVDIFKIVSGEEAEKPYVSVPLNDNENVYRAFPVQRDRPSAKVRLHKTSAPNTTWASPTHPRFDLFDKKKSNLRKPC